MEINRSECEVLTGGFATPNNKQLNIKLRLYSGFDKFAQEFTLSPKSTQELIESLQKSLNYLNEGAEILAGGCR